MYYEYHQDEIYQVRKRPPLLLFLAFSIVLAITGRIIYTINVSPKVEMMAIADQVKLGDKLILGGLFKQIEHVAWEVGDSLIENRTQVELVVDQSLLGYGDHLDITLRAYAKNGKTFVKRARVSVTSQGTPSKKKILPPNNLPRFPDITHLKTVDKLSVIANPQYSRIDRASFLVKFLEEFDLGEAKILKLNRYQEVIEVVGPGVYLEELLELPAISLKVPDYDVGPNGKIRWVKVFEEPWKVGFLTRIKRGDSKIICSLVSLSKSNAN